MNLSEFQDGLIGQLSQTDISMEISALRSQNDSADKKLEIAKKKYEAAQRRYEAAQTKYQASKLAHQKEKSLIRGEIRLTKKYAPFFKFTKYISGGAFEKGKYYIFPFELISDGLEYPVKDSYWDENCIFHNFDLFKHIYHFEGDAHDYGASSDFFLSSRVKLHDFFECGLAKVELVLSYDYASRAFGDEVRFGDICEITVTINGKYIFRENIKYCIHDDRWGLAVDYFFDRDYLLKKDANGEIGWGGENRNHLIGHFITALGYIRLK